MSSIKTTTIVVNGAAAEAAQVVAIEDDRRKFIALYAKTGSCKVSLGNGTHANDYMVLAEGNLLELDVNTLDKVTYSTTDTVLHVLQDIDSNVALTSDNLILTSDGEVIYYKKKRNLSVPVFI